MAQGGDTTDYKALWIARLSGTLSGEIVIPEEVTSLVNQAFLNLPNITAFKTLATQDVGESIFTLSVTLTTCDLCSATTRIRWRAFPNINTLICRATTPPTLANGAFYTSPMVIKVPSASVNAYKTASNWSTYASIITAIDE
jgi:hypothetical protein